MKFLSIFLLRLRSNAMDDDHTKPEAICSLFIRVIELLNFFIRLLALCVL